MAEPPPAGPRLLDAEPDAPTRLPASWQPHGLPASPARRRLPWTALGVAMLITGAAVFSAIAFVLDLAARHPGLGLGAGLTFCLGLGLIADSDEANHRFRRKPATCSD